MACVLMRENTLSWAKVVSRSHHFYNSIQWKKNARTHTSLQQHKNDGTMRIISVQANRHGKIKYEKNQFPFVVFFLFAARTWNLGLARVFSLQNTWISEMYLFCFLVRKLFFIFLRNKLFAVRSYLIIVSYWIEEKTCYSLEIVINFHAWYHIVDSVLLAPSEVLCAHFPFVSTTFQKHAVPFVCVLVCGSLCTCILPVTLDF